MLYSDKSKKSKSEDKPSKKTEEKSSKKEAAGGNKKRKTNTSSLDSEEHYDPPSKRRKRASLDSTPLSDGVRSTSRRGLQQPAESEEDLHPSQLNQLLTDMKANSDAWPFLKPVSKKVVSLNCCVK